MNEKTIENKVISHLKQYGFLNKSNEIYNGFSKSWDLGINGSVLKNNIKKAWLEFFITSEELNFLIETPILTHEKVLESSGHKKNFSDWIVKCKKCKKTFRVDKILTEKENKNFLSSDKEKKELLLSSMKCSECNGKFEETSQFNLMLKTSILHEDKSKDSQIVYLRPETCQGIFINFKNIVNTLKKELPFGIGQIGKSFRNEVTLNHGIFRTREFEQLELEFFLQEDEEKWWKYWTEKSDLFFKKIISGKKDLVSCKEIEKDELPHYSKKTVDLQFNYQFGWGEVCSISNRGNYDLKNHSEKSSVFLGMKKDVFPNVIEVSFGVERIMLALLESSYCEEKIEKSNLERKFLKIHPLLAPYFISVVPLSKQLRKKSREIYYELVKMNIFSVGYEETGNIGNRYRRQDSIGTKFCITIDFETDKNNEVTIRERDSMKQRKVKVDELEKEVLNMFLEEKKKFINS